MAYGLRVYDATGLLQLDITDRITRVLGSLDTGTANGIFTMPDISGTGGDYWVCSLDGPNTPWFGNQYGPSVTRNGAVISWIFTAPAARRLSARVLYGAC